MDILPERFDLRVNALLGDGGHWLNFGSLSFHDTDPLRATALPSVARRKRIVSWSARKKRDVKKVPRYHALPEWLVRVETRDDVLATS